MLEELNKYILEFKVLPKEVSFVYNYYSIPFPLVLTFIEVKPSNQVTTYKGSKFTFHSLDAVDGEVVSC